MRITVSLWAAGGTATSPSHPPRSSLLHINSQKQLMMLVLTFQAFFSSFAWQISPPDLTLTNVYLWPRQPSVIPVAVVTMWDISVRSWEQRPDIQRRHRENYGKATFSSLWSVEIQPQAALPDLNLNACLHLCHRNNPEWFGLVDWGKTIYVCGDHHTVIKVKCHGAWWSVSKWRWLIAFMAAGWVILYMCVCAKRLFSRIVK